MEYKKGDIVNFIGTKHYKQPNGKVFFTIKPGLAKINAIMPSAQHPYYLEAEPEGQSTVHGWVDEKDLDGKQKTIKIKSISFANSKKVKICFSKEHEDGIEIFSTDWKDYKWIAVCRPKDPNNAEQLAHMAEIARAKQLLKDIQFTNTAFIDICLEAAKMPIAENLISKKSLINSGLFNCFTSDDYIQQSNFLRRGDILLSNYSSAIVLSNGKKSIEQGTPKKVDTTPTVNKTLIGRGIGYGTAIKDVQVYSGAASTFNNIGIIKEKEVIEVLAIDINNWYRIVWPSSEFGYAYVLGDDFTYLEKDKEVKRETFTAKLKPTEQNKEMAGIYRTITPATVRQGPNTTYTSLTKLPKNIEVKNYGYYTPGEKVDWLYIQTIYKNNVYNGFVSSNCLIKK